MAKVEFAPVVIADNKTLANAVKGNSAFYENLVFTLGAPVKLQKKDDAAAKIHHVFPAQTPAGPLMNPDGTQAYIWLSSYFPNNQKRNINNEIVEKDGTADKAIFAIINDPVNADKSLDTIDQLVVAALAGKSVKVRRKAYQALTVFDGKTSVTTKTVVCLDFV